MGDWRAEPSTPLIQQKYAIFLKSSFEPTIITIWAGCSKTGTALQKEQPWQHLVFARGSYYFTTKDADGLSVWLGMVKWHCKKMRRCSKSVKAVWSQHCSSPQIG